MGEIADMMLDGTLCEGCGVYMGECGFTQRCHSCRTDDNRPHAYAKVPCPTCGKSVNFIGLPDHHKSAHGVVLTASGKTPCTVCKKLVKLAGMADHIKDVHGGAA